MRKEIIEKFLNSWKQGVIEIGKAFQHDGDFKKLAEIFIEKHFMWRFYKSRIYSKQIKNKINEIRNRILYTL